MWYTAYHPYTHQDNLDFTSDAIQDVLTDEMKFYKQNGGQSVVEVTTFGKSLTALAKMSRLSGVNIVGNTGFYIAPAFPDSIITQSMESLYATMKDEFVNGVDGIKPGVIGVYQIICVCKNCLTITPSRRDRIQLANRPI